MLVDSSNTNSGKTVNGKTQGILLTGKILFYEKLINESLNYINSFSEITAFAMLPNALKCGIFIDEHQDHKRALANPTDAV